MANPIYEKNTAIQPAQAVTGFQEGLGNVARGTSGLADMAYQVAQNASLEQARQAGVEAAKNPGRQLLPVITPSDAEFVKAFKQEVYQSVKYDTGKSLNELYHAAAKDPSNTSLAEYEKAAQEVIGTNLGSVPEDLKKHLQRDLEGAYQTGYFQLATAVNNKNKQYMAHQQAAQFEQTGENIYTNERIGLQEEAAKNYEEGIARISQLEQSGQLLPDEAKARRNELWLKREMGAEDKKTEDEIKNGTFEESVKHFRENRPEHMSPAMHDQLVLHKMQYGGQYNAALKGQQNLDYTQAQTLFAQGDLAGAMGYRDSMGPANRADFDLYVARHSADQTQLAEKANFVVENLNNPIALANVTPEPLNYAVDKIIIPIAESAKGSPL